MSSDTVFELCFIASIYILSCPTIPLLLWHVKQIKHSLMNTKHVYRSSADRFINYERKYVVVLIRKGSYYEELPVFARNLYQACAHSVHLIAYAMNKLGVIDVIIYPVKAGKNGISVYRCQKGENSIIKHLPDIHGSDISVSEILAGWNSYKPITHFLG